ncbi:hypothetical protein KKC60_00995 [Patescibacteria group bacterium]|nr:hypothetical protein [Patescibacteria group bacterium]
MKNLKKFASMLIIPGVFAVFLFMVLMFLFKLSFLDSIVFLFLLYYCLFLPGFVLQKIVFRKSLNDAMVFFFSFVFSLLTVPSLIFGILRLGVTFNKFTVLGVTTAFIIIEIIAYFGLNLYLKKKDAHSPRS